MWLDKYFFIKSVFFFSISVGWDELFVGIEPVNPSCLKRVIGLLTQALASLAQVFEPLGSDAGDDFANFERQSLIQVFQRGPAAHQQIPNGHREFARDGSRRQIEGAFAGQQLFTPLGQRMVGAQDGLRGLDYGPFASDVKLALHDFANRNWLQEEKLGQMIALRVGSQYEKERLRYEDVLRRHERKIIKTVDLFSRIKNTEQAEEVLTVLFASRQLKQMKPQNEVAEKDIYDFIMDWKKAWRTDEKKSAVASAIRNLVMLGWMRLQFSESIPDVI
jgi:hypothetical protein